MNSSITPSCSAGAPTPARLEAVTEAISESEDLLLDGLLRVGEGVRILLIAFRVVRWRAAHSTDVGSASLGTHSR